MQPCCHVRSLTWKVHPAKRGSSCCVCVAARGGSVVFCSQASGADLRSHDPQVPRARTNGRQRRNRRAAQRLVQRTRRERLHPARLERQRHHRHARHAAVGHVDRPRLLSAVDQRRQQRLFRQRRQRRGLQDRRHRYRRAHGCPRRCHRRHPQRRRGTGGDLLDPGRRRQLTLRRRASDHRQQHRHRYRSGRLHHADAGSPRRSLPPDLER